MHNAPRLTGVEKGRAAQLGAWARRTDGWLKSKCGGSVKTEELDLADELRGPGTPRDLRQRGSIIATTSRMFEDMHAEGSADGVSLQRMDTLDAAAGHVRAAYGACVFFYSRAQPEFGIPPQKGLQGGDAAALARCPRPTSRGLAAPPAGSMRACAERRGGAEGLTSRVW